MAKATTVKDAIAKWEEKNGMKASEGTEVLLSGLYPPIEKLDSSLSSLTSCEKLSLSTNCIEKINFLNSLKNLRILSLGRNNIRSLAGIEAVSDSLEQLWISYNFIDRLKNLCALKKLKVLFMANNLVKDWAEFVRLNDLPALEDLLFVGNPLQENNEETFRDDAIKRIPRIKKLDGIPVVHDEGEEE